MLTEKIFTEKIAAMGGQLYIAGGWVRDLLIGREPPDKDYVVCGVSAEDFQRNFSVARVGRQFPVFLIDVDGVLCEAALARTERKSGAGYRGFEPRFSPETTIEEDLFRRDTTMNSMAFRLPDGAIIDPFGGQRDIAARVIRATSEHFREDPVRALRAARQAAQLDFSVDDATSALMRDCLGELMGEPPERIFAEAAKAFRAPQPELFFAELRRAGLLGAVFPELGKLANAPGTFERTADALRRAAALTEKPEPRFAALVLSTQLAISPDADALRSAGERMKLPRGWARLAGFVCEQRAKLAAPLRAEDVVQLMERIRRLSLNPDDILAVCRSALGREPDFLARYWRCQEILDAARRNIAIPGQIPPRDRGAWLARELAKALDGAQCPFP